MKKIETLLFMEIGTFLFALGIGMFILPGKVLSGGVAGITTLITYYIDLPEDILTIVLNIGLFVLGSIFLGKEFFLNTLIFSVSYPFWLLLVTRVMPSYEVDPILASLYGGFVCEVGVGVLFRFGGSSGGTDAIALIIEKYFKVKASRTMAGMDTVTVIAGLYIYGLNPVLIGLLSVFMLAFTMEKVIDMYGGIEAKKFEIISDRYEEICRDVMTKLERGVTLLDVTGGYTGNVKKMLVVVVSEEQSSMIKEIISAHDPAAFVVISQTKEVNGEGFTFEVRM